MSGSPDEKREILATVGSNLTLFNKILNPDMKKEYCFIEGVIKTDSTTSQEFEPEKEGVTTTQLETLWSQNLSLLAAWDDFRQTNWASEIEYPELTLKQTQELLSITLTA